jgi:hypothetical protein
VTCCDPFHPATCTGDNDPANDAVIPEPDSSGFVGGGMNCDNGLGTPRACTCSDRTGRLSRSTGVAWLINVIADPGSTAVLRPQESFCNAGVCTVPAYCQPNCIWACGEGKWSTPGMLTQGGQAGGGRPAPLTS